MIKIETINNGWLITMPSEETGISDSRQAFTYDDEKMDYEFYEAETVRYLLYYVLDSIKPNSKHANYNIEIKIEKNKD